jgi:hypothetical protein
VHFSCLTPLTHPTLAHGGTELHYNSFATYQRNSIVRDRPTQSLPALGQGQVSVHETLPPFTTNPWLHSLRASVSRPLPINFARAKHPVHPANVVQMIQLMAQHLSQLHLPHPSDLPLVRHFHPNWNAPLASPVLKLTLLTYHTSSINHIQPMKSSISLGPPEMEISEALFDYVSRTRDLPSVNNLTIEQEWQLSAWSGKIVMAGGEESRRAYLEAG